MKNTLKRKFQKIQQREYPSFTTSLRSFALIITGLCVLTAMPCFAAPAKSPATDDSPALDAPIPADAQTSSSTAQATTPAAPPASTPASTLAATKNFWSRWAAAYVADWTGHSPDNGVTDTKRRGTPPPISSPPFPASDWPVGGTMILGAPDTQVYILQQAINGNVGHNKIYGYIAIGGNGSTNNRGNTASGSANVPANSPSAYDEYPNVIVLDQAAIYFERLPDTVQRDHFDWGYRITPLYGQDYRFTTSHGMFSQQLLVKNAQYGFDPVMFYVDLYFPKVAQGMDLRIGRYISLPDIEAQLAPNNYTYSHSILYAFDCYTQLGINASIKINDHWLLQGGISPGCDTMPWTTDAKVTGNACITYTWRNGGDALNTCDNTINDGEYAYNNLTAFYETWYHRIDTNWHTDTEGWYQYMKDTPNMFWYDGGYARSATTPWPETNGGGNTLNFGAVCEDPRLPVAKQTAKCNAKEWAIVNYVERAFAHNEASLNIRNEIVNDIDGQRGGTPGYYEEHSVGFDFWLGSSVTFRPELSYTHSFSKYGLRALDIAPGSAVASAVKYNLNPAGGPTQAFPWTGKTQALTLAADIIWHF